MDKRKPCDQCARRKVRCNYDTPCNRCQDSKLQCTHSIVRRKRGPRKGRGAVLDRLRANSHGSDTSQPVQDGPFSPANGSTAPQVSLPTSFAPTSAPIGTFDSPHSLGEPQTIAPGPIFDPQPTNAAPFDDSFLTFDEFAQNVLADSSYFAYEPTTNALDAQGLLAGTPTLPAPTPLDSIATPHTTLPTTIALPEEPEQFEVTEIVQRSVELFFEHLHITYALFSQETAQSWLQKPHLLSRSEQSLIWSICAMSLVLVDNWPDLGTEQRAVSARRFVRKCWQLRMEWDFMEEACFEDILTSLFIGITYFELKCRKMSWTYVREAITLAVGAGLHNSSTYMYLDQESQVRRSRLFALLYITERGAVIPDGFPVSILMPPHLIDGSLPGEGPTIMAGLRALHDLFSTLDFSFVKLWNDPSHAVFDSSGFAELALLQTHLREVRFQDRDLTDIQRADVLITQQWLRLIFWQLALKLGYISISAEDPAFTYNYPIDIALDLCEVVRSLPPNAIQVHGLNIFEKQFEVAYSLMDTLTLSGTALPEHHECLRYLLLSLSASPNSRQIYVRTLEKKMGAQHKYRSLAGVELLRDDTGSRQNSRRQSTAFAAPSRARVTEERA